MNIYQIIVYLYMRDKNDFIYQHLAVDPTNVLFSKTFRSYPLKYIQFKGI